MSRVRLDKDSPVANRGTIADGLVLSSRLILLYLTQPGQFADERVGRLAWQQWEGSRTSGPLSLELIILASISIVVVLISTDNDICPTTPVSASDRRFPGGWPAAGVRGASTGPSPG
ncbi:uncharacterized protein APUU_41021S [Aspergillus puulaauensis]|uniref:Uncharacterized protein n=1 Tax=Aspergillus puulaauensis TaxID=1220207 RepID=A0A7R7XN36_9EURO|nr:uncharacterized protein APUU_41021S [Aspergillus puulaauensis]BCS24577.1 hypothetical protein APUU_41021S [Aspergillus puulaauensis]